jgi:hypothetical protein
LLSILYHLLNHILYYFYYDGILDILLFNFTVDFFVVLLYGGKDKKTISKLE